MNLKNQHCFILFSPDEAEIFLDKEVLSFYFTSKSLFNSLLITEIVRFLLQEIELAADAEKLAKCQETISQLGKQFESLLPQVEIHGSPQNGEIQAVATVELTDDEAVTSHLNQSESHSQLTNLYADPTSLSNSEVITSPLSPTSSSNLPRLISDTMSGSSLNSAPTPEKYTRASFGRIYTSRRRM